MRPSDDFEVSEVERQLYSAGRTLMALHVPGCWPTGYRSGMLEILPQAIEAEFGGRYLQTKIGHDPPTNAQISAMDRAWRAIALHLAGMTPAAVRHRQIMLRRSLQHPDTERHVYSFRRLADEMHLSTVHVRRLWDSGVLRIAIGIRRGCSEVKVGHTARLRVGSLSEKRAA